MQVINDTPFVARNFVHVDRNGGEQLVLVAKATFSMLPGMSKTAVYTKQRSIEFEDCWEDEPGASSVRYESDFGMVKTATNLVLIGHAYPKSPESGQVDAGLKIGDTGKVVRVFGDRFWQESGMGLSISSPQAFEKMPLVFERAFGGVDNSHADPKNHELEARNPVGTGFRATTSAAFTDGIALPNLENPSELIRSANDRPEPCGLGFIGANWLPRRRYQGTYDEAWMEQRMPLPPTDFDERFYNSAAPGLICPGYLQGGEPVVVIGATRDGRRSFYLPGVSLKCTICIDVDVVDLPVSLNTVVVDTDAEEIVLVWRGSFSIHKRTEEVRWTHMVLDAPVQFAEMDSA